MPVREDVNSADFVSEISGYFSVLMESCPLGFGIFFCDTVGIFVWFFYLDQGELEYHINCEKTLVF